MHCVHIGCQTRLQRIGCAPFGLNMYFSIPVCLATPVRNLVELQLLAKSYRVIESEATVQKKKKRSCLIN